MRHTYPEHGEWAQVLRRPRRLSHSCDADCLVGAIESHAVLPLFGAESHRKSSVPQPLAGSQQSRT